jgi:hypothetical protein
MILGRISKFAHCTATACVPPSTSMMPQPRAVFAQVQRTAESQHGCWSVWTKTLGHKRVVKYGSLIAALSSGIAICPFGVMVLSEVAHCAS